MKRFIECRTEGSTRYEIYREVTGERGARTVIWTAQQVDIDCNPLGDPLRISYDQARGIEPIGDRQSVAMLAKQLGRILLPH